MNRFRLTTYILAALLAAALTGPAWVGAAQPDNRSVTVEEAAPNANPGHLDAWRELEGLVRQATRQIRVWTSKTVYNEGENMIINCRVDRDGYLNILTLGPGQTAPTVLFPNKYHPDNRVPAHSTISIPTTNDRFSLRVSRPLGRSLVVVFHTQERINAYEDAGGSSKGLFVPFSTKSSRSIAVEGEKTNSGAYFGAGKFVVTAR